MALFGAQRTSQDESLVRVELARVQGTLAALIEQMKTSDAAQAAIAADHEVRIRAGERWRYAVPVSAFAAIAAAIAAIVNAHA